MKVCTVNVVPTSETEKTTHIYTQNLNQNEYQLKFAMIICPGNNQEYINVVYIVT